jgi:hypothetical protein
MEKGQAFVAHTRMATARGARFWNGLLNLAGAPCTAMMSQPLDGYIYTIEDSQKRDGMIVKWKPKYKWPERGLMHWRKE